MPDKKLPLALSPDALAAAPAMVIGLGFDCPVHQPLNRSTRNRGMTISVTDGPQGPVLIVGLADQDGRALAGMIDRKAFPGFLELMTRQCQNMRDRLAAPPADPDKEAGRRG